MAAQRSGFNGAQCAGIAQVLRCHPWSQDNEVFDSGSLVKVGIKLKTITQRYVAGVGLGRDTDHRQIREFVADCRNQTAQKTVQPIQVN